MPHRSFWLQEVEGDAPDAPPLQGDHARGDRDPRRRLRRALDGPADQGARALLRRRGARAGHLRRRRVRDATADSCSRGGRSSPRSSRSAAPRMPCASLAVPRPRSARSATSARRTGSTRSSGRPAGSGRRRRRRRWARGRASLAAVREARRRALPPPLPGRGRRPHGLARASRRRVRATAATVQPAALARGLRRAALASGVRIYEHTRVRSFSRRARRSSSGPTRGTADGGEAGHRLERLGGRDPGARAGDRRDHERHGDDGARAGAPLGASAGPAASASPIRR